MKAISNVPKEVVDWLKVRLNGRTLVYSPGDFDNYSNSKSSACWVKDNGTGNANYRIAVCVPSPRFKGDTLWCFFDYKKG